MRETLPLHWNVLGQATYPKPDLVITKLVVSAKTKRKPVSVTATVANIGADAADGVTVRFYDNQLGLGDFTAPITLPSGASANVTMAWPTKPEKGTHLVGAVVDLNNTIEEENDQNNWAQRSVTFKGSKVSNGASEHP
jgi:subtilase family serine protease